MEVRQAVLALDLVNPQLDLAEGLLLILVEVSEGDLDDATLQGVVRVFWNLVNTPANFALDCVPRTKALGPVDKGLADVLHLED